MEWQPTVGSKDFLIVRKDRIMKRTLLIFAFFLAAISLSAQPGNPVAPAPIDGGVSLLIAAGAALGGKKLYNLKKQNA